MESQALLSEPNVRQPTYEIVKVETNKGLQKGIYIYGNFYKMLHGWYSYKMSKTSHTHIYLNEYDKPIHVTIATDFKKCPSSFTDVCYKGKIFKHVGSYKEK